ncbi:activin receptor type-2A [Schistocerca nitens]|uniref:activin receptor type-2A n=1 Tax=Schistocerca nitens TaxID=7011 RepID=UPI0021184586|nr:activin receptor type-2A [Schistocerca nitens]
MVGSWCIKSTFLVVACFCFGFLGAHVPHKLQCEFYNRSSCISQGFGCDAVQECAVPDAGKNNYCYVVWSNNSLGEIVVSLKGCFLSNVQCQNRTECVEQNENPNHNVFFCCCERDLCNHNFSWQPQPAPPRPTSFPPVTTPRNSSMVSTIVCTIVPVVLLAVAIAVLYYVYRQRNLSHFNEVPIAEPHPLPQLSPILDFRPIQLLEIKARGRFGAVWKAQYKNETVAVKIFPPQDKESWAAEYEVYRLPRISHEAILQFVGVEKRGDNLQAEYWLITAFHERGSLCDYLKSNLVTWPELCRIAESMARGLMHLHEEIPSPRGDLHKPAVAHRDFKSKNVLLRADLSACVADFGLALIFVPGKPCGDTHGQVGTRRYMAPEVLEGAINFCRDSFLRIDMYACGLVLWELASRCTGPDGPVSEYLLPFEEEVGQHPTLEDMQECVVQKKVRPCSREHWRSHPGMAVLCDTIEECWDHDAEARLSASCVVERLSMQARSMSCTKEHI